MAESEKCASHVDMRGSAMPDSSDVAGRTRGPCNVIRGCLPLQARRVCGKGLCGEGPILQDVYVACQCHEPGRPLPRLGKAERGPGAGWKGPVLLPDIQVCLRKCVWDFFAPEVVGEMWDHV